ncbi:MAG: ribonuclease E/G, partial [Rhodobacteraceae bacterium]|nr:ribonuclease E/G [Paracoccaceae bacterium]
CFATLPCGQVGYIRHGRGFRAGEYRVVQVTGYPQAGKSVPLTGQIRLKGRYTVLTPNRPGVNIARSIHDKGRRMSLKTLLTASLPADLQSCGVIARSVSREAGDDVIRAEMQLHTKTLAKIDQSQTDRDIRVIVQGPTSSTLALREWVGIDECDLKQNPRPEQTHQVMEALQSCLAGHVPLKGGGSMDVDVTSALTCIDINTGSASGRGAALMAARQATREMPRHFRLRGLGGQIVIDYPALSHDDRCRIGEELAEAFGQDAVPTRMIGWTRMGLFEMSRKRDRVPLICVMPL